MINIDIDDITLAEARLHLRAFGFQNVTDDELRLVFQHIIRGSFKEHSFLTGEIRKLRSQPARFAVPFVDPDEPKESA